MRKFHLIEEGTVISDSEYKEIPDYLVIKKTFKVKSNCHLSDHQICMCLVEYHKQLAPKPNWLI